MVEEDDDVISFMSFDFVGFDVYGMNRLIDCDSKWSVGVFEVGLFLFEVFGK